MGSDVPELERWLGGAAVGLRPVERAEVGPVEEPDDDMLSPEVMPATAAAAVKSPLSVDAC